MMLLRRVGPDAGGTRGCGHNTLAGLVCGAVAEVLYKTPSGLFLGINAGSLLSRPWELSNIQAGQDIYTFAPLGCQSGSIVMTRRISKRLRARD
jgi:hypothetical protein